MKFLHTMIRVKDLDASLNFFINIMGLVEVRRKEVELAFKVDNIYDYCTMLMEKGVTILRPPRDGHMAFIRTPDQISIELLQAGDNLPIREPWSSMENKGEW